MSAPVQGNTNPDELDARVLQAQGPFGFITSVYQTLRRFKRPYYYGAALPPWFQGGASSAYPSTSPDAVASEIAQSHSLAYEERFPSAEAETLFTTVPHCVIHSYRVYPANRRNAGASDSPGGSTRQKTPSEVYAHDQPLPASGGYNDPDGQIRPDLMGALSDTQGRPPLWESMDSVPDFIRDYVTPETVCYVTPWEYDVFVDFVLVAADMWMLELMRRDFMLALRTFHDRSQTGASNLAGWFFQDVSGAPPEVSRKLDGRYPARTITWRLKQTEAYAFPAQIVDDVSLELHGS
jgi:hypothetical protein